jgi:hypothetical protein
MRQPGKARRNNRAFPARHANLPACIERDRVGPAGAIIMSFFGGAFFLTALGNAVGWSSPILIAPFVIFLAVAFRAGLLIRSGRVADRSEHAGRVIMWSSIGEGVGIFILANVLVNMGYPRLVLPGIAAIVGLHFLPMARAIPFPPFYVLSAALLAAAAAGVVLAQPLGAEVAGVAAAIALWIASIAALYRRAS